MASVRQVLAVASGLAALAVFHQPVQPESQADPAPRYREVCRLVADPRNMFTRVGPPSEQGQLLRLESLATITVNYTGFTPEAQTAFQYAVDIWRNQLTSSAPIVVDATFTSDGFGPTTLGSAGANWIYSDFLGATFPNTWYANALANKLYGGDLSTTPGDDWEITARFNSAFTWYFGTDGLTPAGQYDFVSVVLHELGHGLGFYGSAYVSGGIGTIGRLYGYPDIYDRFVVNGSGSAILSFPTNTAELGVQLLSNDLFWNGPNGVAANAGARPRLYISDDLPTVWEPGSSYSHLDDATYPAGSVNSLMTHAIGAAEAIHDPGPITRGIFTDEGWTVAAVCTYGISSSSATYGQSGGTGTVNVSTTSGCAWTATSSDPSWLAITSGDTGLGNGSVNYSVAVNSGVARTATLTIAGRTFTVTQGPTFSLSPSALRFGAVNVSGTLTSLTSTQTVTLTQDDGPALAWTATPSQPWIQVSPTAGTGNAIFTVNIVNTGALPATGTLSGTILISAPGAANAPSVPVSLALYAPGASSRPIGSFDWLYGETTVSGSIVVGGWALDDVEVSRIELFRDRVPGELPQGVLSVNHPGYDQIYVATAEVVRTLPFGNDTALFIDGARPDIEALFPSSPWNYRAGWGYLMLTWGLPNQGTGTYTLYAYAFDRDGSYPTDYTLLGSKQFTSDNSAEAAWKPFGALDAPYPGETVSGVKLTGGWALTQPVYCEVTNVHVAINSSGVWGPLSPVIYGGPRPDLEPDFPTALFANSPDAGAAYFLDSTAYANGLHQIHYVVEDNCGRQDGIGSRYFTIFNASASLTADSVRVSAAPVEAQGVPVVTRPPEVADAYTAFALTGRPAAALDAPRARDTVRVARGYGQWDAGPVAKETAPRDDRGVSTVAVRPLERVVLHLPRPAGGRRGDAPSAFTYAGYQAAGGQLRRLPIGSSLDTRDGVFYWEPGPGFMGAFDLVFVRTDESGASVQVPVRVEVRGDRASRPGIEPTPGTTAPGPGASPPASESVSTAPPMAKPVEPEPAVAEPGLGNTPVSPVSERRTGAQTPAAEQATGPTAEPVAPAPELTATPDPDAIPGGELPGRSAAQLDPAASAPAASSGVVLSGHVAAPVPAAGVAEAGGIAPRFRADAGSDRTVAAVGGWGMVTLRASRSGVPDDAVYRWSGSFGALEGRNVDVALPLGTHTVTLSVEAGGETSDDTLVVTVRDSSPPHIEARISPRPDERGVVLGRARISWVVTDSESGVARLDGCEDEGLATTGTVRCSATNGAGLTATRVVLVRVAPPM